MSFTAQLLRGVRVTLVLWLLTVVVITLPMLGLARLVAPEAANGSLLQRDGVVVGSRLIGQRFAAGRYLQGRPAGEPNLAASNPELAARVAACCCYRASMSIRRSTFSTWKASTIWWRN